MTNTSDGPGFIIFATVRLDFEEGYTGDIHLLLAKPASKLSRGFPQ
jgi:hypothetical protein